MLDLSKYEGHTPGPWRPGREDMQSYDVSGDPFSSVYTDDDRAGMHLGEPLPLVIARVMAEGGMGQHEEKANARLIADAPALLDELKKLRESHARILKHLKVSRADMLRAWELGGERFDTTDMLAWFRDAIAKAEAL